MTFPQVEIWVFWRDGLHLTIYPGFMKSNDGWFTFSGDILDTNLHSLAMLSGLYSGHSQRRAWPYFEKATTLV